MNLYLFDIDGTLADRDTSELLPNVEKWFLENGNKHRIALVTNQGGVGLRFWMEGGNEGEEAAFGEPEKFPDEQKAIQHINAVIANLPGDLGYRYYVCYAYQSKKSGKWSPTPAGKETVREWSPYFRKPSPGMIEVAIADFGVGKTNTYFVGNSSEDVQAAYNAKINYFDAETFFITEKHED